MKKKTFSSLHGIVYSTDPSFIPPQADMPIIVTSAPSEQPLKILLDKKQRAGKVVTLISGFIGSDADLQLLGKQLRNHCGTGGSAKEGEILIQGDQREKAEQWLLKNGYRQTKRFGK